MWSTTLLTLFEKGGPVMWPLMLASVAGLAIILERVFFFLRHRLPSRGFETDVLELLQAGQTQNALDLAASSRHPVAHITRTYLDNLGCADGLRQDILQREGSRALEAAERNLRGLSLIAHLAPLMGLLGTVTGLVGAFAVIEQMDGMAQPGQLAAGIWESLLTTVTGLVIALPCLAAFYWFEHKADRLARHMKFMISELNELFGKRQSDLEVKSEAEESLTVVTS